jgi:RimJ/RimL family protein N-acetyltransferase
MAETIAETERLLLRCWTAGDRAEFIRHLNTPAVMRWVGGVLEEAAYEVGFDRIESHQRNFGHTFWVVERKGDKALLGFCGLKRVNDQGAGDLTGDFEIGWRLREDAWGQGYAKEAAIASLDLAFGKFSAPHVVALTIEENQPSQGLMKRLGMKQREDLDFDEHHPRLGLERIVVYRIDAPDWPAAREAALA